MNPVYIAAILTPFLSALIIQGITTWFENPEDAPPSLFRLGVVGQLYKFAIVFTSLASQLSLLARLKGPGSNKRLLFPCTSSNPIIHILGLIIFIEDVPRLFPPYRNPGT